MNNLQPFEKHLADQLQQLPVPDREEGWKEMRKLLDRELPEGGTPWSGNRKWWWMGITVAIIIAGLWMSEEYRKKELASSTQNFSLDKNSSDKPLQSSASDPTKNHIKNNSKASEQPANHAPSIDANNPESRIQNLKDAGSSDYSSEKKSSPTEKNISGRENYSGKNEQPSTSSVDKNINIKKQHSQGLEAGIVAALSSAGARANGSRSSQLRSNGNEATQKNLASKDDNGASIVSEEDTRELSATSSIQPISIVDLFYKDPVDQLSIIPSSYQPLRAEPGKTDKAFQKLARKESIKADNRKMSGKSMRGGSKEKDLDLTFAAGLALPQSFAISNQQAPSYGVNATSSRVSDYLPVPFFQYHMNSRLFFQTELQFQSPQYTDRLLVYQNQQQVPQTTTVLEKNIFIEKLYYFHIPFNVYFSPAKNFYVGSGLQFSSLLSGVATYQSNRYDGTTLQNSYSKVQGFKDDSVASKLSSSEWRYQFDANYYLKRFTFGARYNQALSQFVNIQPSATLPYTQGRNQSFFIYLRYNIWEERKN